MDKENHKKMLDHLLDAIMVHLDVEIMFSLKRKDPYEENIDVIKEAFKLRSQEDFAAFGCRLISLSHTLEPFEDYMKETNPRGAARIQKLINIRRCFEECSKKGIEALKKENNHE